MAATGAAVRMNKPRACDGQITVERIERALRATATAVVLHGAAYEPIMDRLISELEKAKSAQAAPDRARAILESIGAG